MKKLIVSLLLLPFFISAEEPQPLYEGSSITFTISTLQTDSNFKWMSLSNGQTLNFDVWEIIKKTTEKIKEPAKRDTVISAISQYDPKYDKVDKIVRLSRADYFEKTEFSYDDHESRIQFIGYIKVSKKDCSTTAKWLDVNRMCGY